MFLRRDVGWGSNGEGNPREKWSVSERTQDVALEMAKEGANGGKCWNPKSKSEKSVLSVPKAGSMSTKDTSRCKHTNRIGGKEGVAWWPRKGGDVHEVATVADQRRNARPPTSEPPTHRRRATQPFSPLSPTLRGAQQHIGKLAVVDFRSRSTREQLFY